MQKNNLAAKQEGDSTFHAWGVLDIVTTHTQVEGVYYSAQATLAQESCTVFQFDEGCEKFPRMKHTNS